REAQAHVPEEPVEAIDALVGMLGAFGFGADETIDETLDHAAIEHHTNQVLDDRAADHRERDVELTSIEERALAPDESESFQRADHAAQGRAGDTELLADLALPETPQRIVAENVEDVEARRRKPIRLQEGAAEGGRPVKRPLHREENRVH